jgi:hypothetical protein
MATSPSSPAPRGIGPAVWVAVCIGILFLGAVMVLFVPALKGAFMHMLETTERASVPSNTRSEQRAITGPSIAYSVNAGPTWQSIFITQSAVGQLIELKFPITGVHLTTCTQVYRLNGTWAGHPSEALTAVGRNNNEIPWHADAYPLYYRIKEGDITFYFAWSEDPTCMNLAAQ